MTGPVHDAARRELCVVVLNWNSSADTRAAVEVLPMSWRTRIIVVDNGSDTQSRELAELRQIEGVTVIPRPDNGGYAAGMNTGMISALARGFTHAALVNADARPRAEDLERLFALAADHAVVGTAQAGPHGGYVTAALGGGAFPRAFDCRGCPTGFHTVDVVSGATIVVALAAVERVGWMDESYFHYAEEIDLCRRLRQSGALIGWSCQTVVQHAVGGSLAHRTAGAHYYTSRNKVLLARKSGVRLWASPRLVKDEATFAVRASRDGQLRAWGHGLYDGARGVTGRWQG